MPLQGGELCIVRNASNLGFSAACNIGAHHTSAPYVLFLNPDCVLAADALSRMIQALVSYPRTGMVGGFLCNPDGTEQPGGRRVFPTPKRAFLRAFGLSRLSKFLPASFSDFLLHEQPLPREPMVVEAISGACMLVRREAIEDVGLWDEGYFLHCEDLDWCMRFRQAGWDVLYVPGARVSHQFGACSRSRPYFVDVAQAPRHVAVLSKVLSPPISRGFVGQRNGRCLATLQSGCCSPFGDGCGRLF